LEAVQGVLPFLFLELYLQLADSTTDYRLNKKTAQISRISPISGQKEKTQKFARKWKSQQMIRFLSKRVIFARLLRRHRKKIYLFKNYFYKRLIFIVL
jgi:hypothetical protein